jgi:hypothetical protein
LSFVLSLLFRVIHPITSVGYRTYSAPTGRPRQRIKFKNFLINSNFYQINFHHDWHKATPNEIPRVVLPTLLVDKHHLLHEHHVFLTMVAKIPYVVPTKLMPTMIWHNVYRRQKNSWQRNARKAAETRKNQGTILYGDGS